MNDNYFKVDFFVLGAQKAGTTTLSKHFQQHPKVDFSIPKEPNFFNWKSEDDWNWYKNLFAKNSFIKGEGSVDYSYRSVLLKTHERIQAHNPHAKFIFILRHPIERIISHYTYNKLRGLTQKEAIIWELESKLEYIQRSRYYNELKPFLLTFPKKQFLFIHFEDLIASTQETFNQCCDFLDIEHYHIAKKKENQSNNELTYKNPTQRKFLLHSSMKTIKSLIPSKIKNKIKNRIYETIERPTLSEDLVRYLYAIIEEDILKMEDYLDCNINHWKTYNHKKYL